MTYGRSVFKALNVFGLDTSRWHELAADRPAWREMIRTGLAPAAFRPLPEPPAPEPISHTKPSRRAAADTNARLAGKRDADAALLALLTSSGRC